MAPLPCLCWVSGIRGENGYLRERNCRMFRFEIRQVVLLGLLLFALLLQGCSEKETPKKVEVVKPVKVMVVGALSNGVPRSFPGTVVAGEKADVGFRVSGQLSYLPVKEGQRVKAGEVIARLDPSDYLTTLRNLQSQLAGATATRKEAQLNFKRNEKLLASDTISRATYDSARSSFENADAKVNALEQQIQQAKLNLDYTELRAPFAGIVAETYVKNYENVQAQQAIVRVDDPRNLDVEIEVPELVIALIRNYKGTLPAPMVKFAAFPDKEFPSKVKEFQTTANPQTRTYTVTMTLKTPKDVVVYPGMTAEVLGNIPSEAGAGIRVPATAVFSDENGMAHVWHLKDDMRVTRIPVKLGELRASDVLVTEGLEEGVRIVTAGVNYLQENQKVRILEGNIGG